MDRNKNKKSTNRPINTNQKKMVALPRMNDYPSRREWEIACWQKIVGSKELLRLLVTTHERHDLVFRAVAVDGLMSGKSYRQIGKESWLSPQTISGIKKALSEKTYRSYLERSKKERKTKKYNVSLFPKTSKPHGRPQRTKYGTLYMP
ncbi:MAG: hypothetical protein AAB920_02320 [Patescibacteria group bacterium]